ncbi:MAG: VOC family protein [Solirubrobacteraceae bacterium]
MGSRSVTALMDGEEIRALLASVQAPNDDLLIPLPPNMTAVTVAAVVEAGADPDEVEAWVRSVRGWAKRMPPLYAPPEASELELLFYIVPDSELESAGAPAITLADSDLIAFVPTTDMSRARPFYETALGLKLEGESPVACAFRAGGVLLRVIVVEQLEPYPFTVLGWGVEDIAAYVEGLTARGVAFERIEGIEQDELGIWRSPGGAQVPWFKDPDGNTLSLTQF